MSPNTTLYLASEDFISELEAELKFLNVEVAEKRGRFFLCEGETGAPLAWAQDTWHHVERIPIISIGDGAKQLRSRGKDWVLVSGEHHRRAQLIAEQISSPREHTLTFPQHLPALDFGSFTLWEKELMLVSRKCAYPLPRGEMSFVENQKDPPSRAYLKLWEALTLLGKWPVAGERCLDLGSSPGSWTWALATLGANVLSMDRSELAPTVAKMSGVEFRKGNAFTLKPTEIGAVDWFFSDVICYPEKLFELVETWLASGLCKRFVCTIKFQGEVDPAVIVKFRTIPGSRVLHLFHNKHELTWICELDS